MKLLRFEHNTGYQTSNNCASEILVCPPGANSSVPMGTAQEESKAVVNSGIFQGPDQKLDQFSGAAADALTQLGVVGVARGRGKQKAQEEAEPGRKKKGRKTGKVALGILWYCSRRGAPSARVPLGTVQTLIRSPVFSFL